MNLFENGLIIYGAGNTGKQFCDLLFERGFRVRAFLDRSAQGEYRDAPIASPYSIDSNFLSLPVLIAVHNRDASIVQIKNDLRKWGWNESQIYSLVDLYRLTEPSEIALPDLYWLGQGFSAVEQERAANARKLFCDDKSRAVFDAQINLRQTGEYATILEDYDNNQYRTEFLEGIKQLDFVDAGCYDGDTIEDFVTHGIDFRSIYAFEPDTRNLHNLQKRLVKMDMYNGSGNVQIAIFPVGLSDQFETLRFNAAGGENSAITEEGDTSIQTAGLDDILINQPISYIKMDIEGAEMAALRGARSIIGQQRPILAICVYHCPNHLWEIPLMINKMNPQYELYLQVYCYNCFETVCYAVDKNTLARLKQ